MHPEDPFTHNWLARRLTNRRIAQRLPVLHGVVVDLGCGARPYEQDILRHAERYIGVDWGSTLHTLCADVVADLNAPLPLPDAMADHVVSFDVLEHLAEPGVMLGEAFRLLRPGGTLTLAVPFQWWVHEEPWDYYRYTRYGLEYLLRKAGFVDIEIAATSGFWAMWLLKLNYQLAKFVMGPRPVRWLVRTLLVPVWWLNQVAGPLLDRAWRGGEKETVGYFVTARRP